MQSRSLFSSSLLARPFLETRARPRSLNLLKNTGLLIAADYIPLKLNVGATQLDPEKHFTDQGHPTTVFCKISVREWKNRLEFSIA